MARILHASALAISLLLTLSPGYAAVATLSKPTWSELKPDQKQILAPLAPEWDSMDQFRRSKWLGIAAKYPTLGAEEQARIQRRMNAWAKLSPEERKQAREQYKSLQKSSPEKKESVKEKWEVYKDLPDAAKTQLKESPAAKAKPKPSPVPNATRQQGVNPVTNPLKRPKTLTPDKTNTASVPSQSTPTAR